MTRQGVIFMSLLCGGVEVGLVKKVHLITRGLEEEFQRNEAFWQEMLRKTNMNLSTECYFMLLYPWTTSSPLPVSLY